MPPRGCYVVAIRGSGTRNESLTAVCHAHNLTIADRVAAILKVDAERIPCQLKAVPGADSGDSWLLWDEQIRKYQSFNWLHPDKSPMKAMALRAKQFSERLANENESTCATPESSAAAPTACSPENAIQAVAGVVNAFANLGAVNQLCEARRKSREQHTRLANAVINGGGLPPGKNFFDALKDVRLDAPRFSSTPEYLDLVESTLAGIVGATNQLAKLIERGGMDSLNAVGGEWATQPVLARLMKIEATAQELLRVVQTERMNEGRIEFVTEKDERQLAADREWIAELNVQFEAARRLPLKTALFPVDQDAINRVADRVADRAAEKFVRRLGGGNGAAGGPTRTEVVLWEGAAHSDRNVRLAHTRSAYLEAHGDVVAALAALKASGHKIARRTFYNHLDALDKAIPHWRDSVQLCNAPAQMHGAKIVGTRGKSRGKAG